MKSNIVETYKAVVKKRQPPPTRPGEILQDYLDQLGLSQKGLADHIGYEVKTINRLVRGHVHLEPRLAVRLAAAFGTTAQFWLNFQQERDIWEEERRMEEAGESLPAYLGGGG